MATPMPMAEAQAWAQALRRLGPCVFLCLCRFVCVTSSTSTLTRADCTVAAGGVGPSNASEGLDSPWGIAVHPSGGLLVADLENSRVMLWEEGASNGTRVAGNGTTQGMDYPVDILVNDDGSLLIADYGNERVLRWEPGATSGTVVVQDNLGISDMAFDDSGGLLLTHLSGHSYVKRVPPGSFSAVDWLGVADTYPIDIEVGSDGLVYVLDFVGVVRFPQTQNFTAGERVAVHTSPSLKGNVHDPRFVK